MEDLDVWELRREFELSTGLTWENRRGDIYIEYVHWLEGQLRFARWKLDTGKSDGH
jgi:hypothetical protein